MNRLPKYSLFACGVMGVIAVWGAAAHGRRDSGEVPRWRNLSTAEMRACIGRQPDHPDCGPANPASATFCSTGSLLNPCPTGWGCWEAVCSTDCSPPIAGSVNAAGLITQGWYSTISCVGSTYSIYQCNFLCSCGWGTPLNTGLTCPRTVRIFNSCDET